ncbi:MAG: DUF2157 domain-containing protein [Nostocoides sp.]
MAAASRASWIDHWVETGLITPAQAAQMRTDLAAGGSATSPGSSHRPSPASIAVEALGYVGGAIIVVGIGLLLSRWWADLGAWGRIALVGLVTLALVGAGMLVPTRTGPGQRLQPVLWLAATVGTAFTTGLLADHALSPQSPWTAAAAALAAAAVSAGLWSIGRHPVQHVSTALAAAIAAMLATAAATSPTETWLWPGLAMCAVGTGWALLADRSLVRPRRIGLYVGAALSGIGAMTTMGDTPGPAIALTVVAAWLVVALRRADLVLLALASAATLVVVPTAVSTWFPGALSAAIALVIIGAVLVAAAVVVVRRR